MGLTLPNQVGTNGVGDPRIPVADVQPGTIALCGVDDDMTVLVIANLEVATNTFENNGTLVGRPLWQRRLVVYGCFNENGGWGEGRVFELTYLARATLSILMIPGDHLPTPKACLMGL